MNGNSKRPCVSRRGLTLVEVIAALAILAAVLSGIVVARARLTRQWEMSRKRIAAVEAANTMLAGWLASTSADRDVAADGARKDVLRSADSAGDAGLASSSAALVGIPRESSGPVPGHPGWVWHTQPIARSDAAALRAEVIRFEIVDEASWFAVSRDTSSSNAKAPEVGRIQPLVMVEVLRPLNDPPEAVTPGSAGGGQ